MAISVWNTVNIEYLTQKDDKYKLVAQVRSNDKILLFELRVFEDTIPTRMGISLRPEEMKWVYNILTSGKKGTRIGARQIFVDPQDDGAIITLVGYDLPRMLFIGGEEIKQLQKVYDGMWPAL